MSFLTKLDRKAPIEYAERVAKLFNKNTALAATYLSELIDLDLKRQKSISGYEEHLPVHNNICNVKSLVRSCFLYDDAFEALETIYKAIRSKSGGKAVKRLAFGTLLGKLEHAKEAGDLTLDAIRLLTKKEFFGVREPRPENHERAPLPRPAYAYPRSDKQYHGSVVF